MKVRYLQRGPGSAAATAAPEGHTAHASHTHAAHAHAASHAHAAAHHSSHHGVGGLLRIALVAGAPSRVVHVPAFPRVTDEMLGCIFLSVGSGISTTDLKILRSGSLS